MPNINKSKFLCFTNYRHLRKCPDACASWQCIFIFHCYVIHLLTRDTSKVACLLLCQIVSNGKKYFVLPVWFPFYSTANRNHMKRSANLPVFTLWMQDDGDMQAGPLIFLLTCDSEDSLPLSKYFQLKLAQTVTFCSAALWNWPLVLRV